jgi:hypothetical protein
MGYVIITHPKISLDVNIPLGGTCMNAPAATGNKQS